MSASPYNIKGHGKGEIMLQTTEERQQQKTVLTRDWWWRFLLKNVTVIVHKNNNAPQTRGMCKLTNALWNELITWWEIGAKDLTRTRVTLVRSQSASVDVKWHTLWVWFIVIVSFLNVHTTHSSRICYVVCRLQSIKYFKPRTELSMEKQPQAVLYHHSSKILQQTLWVSPTRRVLVFLWAYGEQSYLLCHLRKSTACITKN